MANKAIITSSPGVATITDVPIPSLPADDYILVKTTAVSVNPTDWKHVYGAAQLGCVGCQVGCDYAGIVEEVGPGVTKPFKKGDRICGPVNGSNAFRKEDGTFANYIIVKGDMQIPTPDNLTDVEAATLGIAVSTVGQSLYQALKLPLPNAPTTSNPFIFIYGGSTAMGITGIQCAKLSGLTVITTASPHNFAYVKSLGADFVFDYKSASIVDDIRAVAGDKVKFAWDCQSDAASATICAKVLSSEGGAYSSLLPGVDQSVKAVNPKIQTTMTIAYSIFGERWSMGADAVEGDAGQYEFGKKFWEIGRELLVQGKLKPINVTVNREGAGLEGVLRGLELLKEGKVSAGKLVYTL